MFGLHRDRLQLLQQEECIYTVCDANTIVLLIPKNQATRLVILAKVNIVSATHHSVKTVRIVNIISFSFQRHSCQT